MCHTYILLLHISIHSYMAESERCGRSLLIASCVCCHFLCEVCCVPYTLHYCMVCRGYIPYFDILHHYLV